MKRFGAVLVLLLLIVFPVFAQVALIRGDLIRADYGSGNQWVEVTQRVRSLIRGEFLNFRVDNDTLGVDPRPSEAKSLRLQFRDENGRTQQLTFQEKQHVDLLVNSAANLGGQAATTWGGSNTPSNGACFYRSGFDSERFCLEAGQNLSVVPSGFNDQISSIQVFGNAMVTVFKDSGFSGDHQTFSSSISDLRNAAGSNWKDRISSVRVDPTDSTTWGTANSYGGGLQITHAVYGTGNQSWDVTNRLNSQIRDNQLSMQVSNDTMGGDPTPNQRKTLTVDYLYNGGRGQVVINEGGTLNLPANLGGQAATTWGGSNTPSNGACFYRSGFDSERFCLEAGQSLSVVPSGFNDQISSIQVFGNAMVTVFKDSGFSGDHQTFSSSISDLRNAAGSNWKDRISSVRVDPTDSTTWGTANSYGSQTIRCESNNNARNYCPVDARGGVRLSRQISGSPCIQGSTWGYDSNQVWVDNGCRADFEVSLPYGANTSYTPYGTYTTIPNGTQLAIRTNEVIDSAKSTAGQKFSAVMYADVSDSSGAIAIRKSSDVELVIRSTAGSDLVLDIDSVVVGGQRYVVSTSDLEQKGGQGIGANRRTAGMVGGGAAVGAIIGAIVGGGKGAAIGAGVGAAGGAGAVVLTKGKEVKVPAETILNFKLDTDLRLQLAR